jgi:hypothetical protein
MRMVNTSAETSDWIACRQYLLAEDEATVAAMMLSERGCELAVACRAVGDTLVRLPGLVETCLVHGLVGVQL